MGSDDPLHTKEKQQPGSHRLSQAGARHHTGTEARQRPAPPGAARHVFWPETHSLDLMARRHR